MNAAGRIHLNAEQDRDLIMLIDPMRLVILGESYAAAKGLALSTVSTLIFNDGKVLDRLRAGRDITVRRYEKAIEWFESRRATGGWS